MRSYLGDIVLCTETWTDHLTLPYKFFGKQKEANLTINLEKSEFGPTNVAHLGHTVGNSTLAPLEMKVQAIKNLSVSKNKREVRRILGFVGFY